MAKVIDIVSYLTSKYPLELASSFDLGKVGLQFGNKFKDVKKVLIALDGTLDVVEEAIEKGVDLLITHHPFLFTPILNLDYNSPLGKKMLNVFKNELNIFSMHTNFDVAENGMNEILASKLGLTNVYAIPEIPTADSYMRIGNISICSLSELATLVKNNLSEDHVRIVGDYNKKIEKVAILGGSGGSFVLTAKKLGCDCIITGEVKHNNAIDAIENDIAIIEVSHSVEANYKDFVKDSLEKIFKDVEFILSTKDNNPFNII